MRLALALCVAAAAAAPAWPAATATLEVSPVKARIGDALDARITVHLDAGATFALEPLPPEWGDAQVLSGAWLAAPAGATTRSWAGRIAIYKLGAVTIPPIPVPLGGGLAGTTVDTAPVTVTVEASVKPGKPGEEGLDVSDLKPPATIPPDFGPLRIALAALALLLIAAGTAWWLWRRYAARLAAVAIPPDPFRKLPPHVWVYEELRKLLARRLAEEGKIGLFYDELTRIVKQYLEGRYRIDLLERTTSEVPAALQTAGAPVEAGRLSRALLESGDLVKFARVPSGPAECRQAVEEAYRLVDLTKPADAADPGPAAAEPPQAAGVAG